MKVIIDKGIPYPLQTEENGGGGKSRNKVIFPWNEMEIGDSFLFREVCNYKNLQLARIACSNRSSCGRIYLKAEYEGSVRIWRVK